MLKGDLAGTPLPDLLEQLADGAATGCLHVLDPDGEPAKVFLRGGRVYAVVVPGQRPQLGARLVSSGALAPEALAEALEAQRTELQGWRLGELLVHLSYVDQPVVEAFVQEQVRESMSDLLQWRAGTWKFRINERTREDVAPPVAVAELLAEVHRRRREWQAIEEAVHGPAAVPLLSAAGSGSSEMEIDADAWSLLCKVDGVRTVADLARDCGFTLYEAGQVVYALVQAGLLEVEEDLTGPEPAVVTETFDAGAVASRLVSALSGVGTSAPAGPSIPAARAARTLHLPADDDEIDGSIDRVSAALAALMGPSTASDDIFNAPAVRARHTPSPELDPEAERKQAEKDRRAARRREQDAAELASAQAELEVARTAAEADAPIADVVDLDEARRGAARRDEEAEAARLAEEARLAEAAAQAAEALRVAEATRLALEAEEARLAAEAEAARQAEEAEALRVAEEARLAAEAEAARLAEEAEAFRIADEARAAEESRLAQEAEEAARAAEEARLAEEAWYAQQAAAAAEELRLAQEAEAIQLAEQARLADEARQQEEARLAAEADAARIASEPTRTTEASASAAAAAFAELSVAASVDVVESAPVVPEPELEIEDDEPRGPYLHHDTDTAALLRELTSLGLDDDPPPPPPTRPVNSGPARPVATAPAKKKKGLFGR